MRVRQHKAMRFLCWGVLLPVLMLVMMHADGSQLFAQHAMQGTQRTAVGGSWSDNDTWQNGLPQAGDAVVIPADVTVYLDTDVDVKSILVDGELKCIDEDVEMSVEWIMIHGLFQCGTETERFTNQLTITLVGENDGDNMMGMGDKFIGVMQGGRLELHGEHRMSWTSIDGTVEAGATKLTLVESTEGLPRKYTPWRSGDKIIIAPTQMDPSEGEVLTITSIEADGKTIHFAEPLAHRHYGVYNEFNRGPSTWYLDERAEVGLLSRNITIQGDAGSEADGYGGHIMSMKGAVSHIEGVELHRMGQEAILARYPFHWHLARDVDGQYIKDSSIHHSFNRCVTIHGTDRALVQSVVCYDFIGHGFFLEDGFEQYNKFHSNLGIWAQKPDKPEGWKAIDGTPKQWTDDDSIPESDKTHILPLETDLRTAAASNGPAVFWIAHPNNEFINNVAAGSEGSGIWYGLQDFVTGESSRYVPESRQVTPLTAQFGVFNSNSVHSSVQGFTSCTGGGGVKGMTPPQPALIEGLSVNQTEQGVWPCGSNFRSSNAIFQYARIANTYNGVQAPNPMTFKDSLWVAYTDNRPANPGRLSGSSINELWRGVTNYDQGSIYDNVHFLNYDDPKLMSAFMPGGGSHKHMSNRMSGATFKDSNVFLDPSILSRKGSGPAEWGNVLHDLDGSLLNSGQALVSDHPLMWDESCYRPADVKTDLVACPYRYGQIRLEHRGGKNERSFAELGKVTIVRSDGVQNSAYHISSRYIHGAPMDADHYFSYRYDSGINIGAIMVALYNVNEGDTAVIELLDVPEPASIHQAWINQHGWTEAASLDAFINGTGRQWLYRDHSLFLKLRARPGNDWAALDLVRVCINTGCKLEATTINPPPKVEITSPADGIRVNVGDDVEVTATLADSDGIRSARLYLGTDQISKVDYGGGTISAQYASVIPNVAEGKYAIKLVVEDGAGQTFTGLQQLIVGDSSPNIRITNLNDHDTILGEEPLTIEFELAGWMPAVNGDHIRVMVNNQLLVTYHQTDPISIAPDNLRQGLNEIQLVLAEQGKDPKAMSDTRYIQVMKDGVLANFEDGVDGRGELLNNGADISTTGKLEQLRFAWGAPDFVTNDSGDDNNFFIITELNNGDHIDYVLNINPPQDWSRKYAEIELWMNENPPYSVMLGDVDNGISPLVLKESLLNTPVISVTTSTFNLPDAQSKFDAVDKIILRFEDPVSDEKPQGVRLRNMRLTGTPTISEPVDEVDEVVYFSSSQNDISLGDTIISDEDIIAYNRTTNSGALLFDASDVGITADLEAFHILDDGSLLLNFEYQMNLPNIGRVDDSDIVRFIPTTLGLETSGLFELYFDGSDVALSSSYEDIDALHRLPDGQIVISTKHSATVGDISAGGEDLLLFTPSSLGSDTAGTWSLYLDGSAVGLHRIYGKIDAVSVDATQNDIHFSTAGQFTSNGQSISWNDVAGCSGGGDGASDCAVDVKWPGSEFGLSSQNIDGLSVGGSDDLVWQSMGQLVAADQIILNSSPNNQDDGDDIADRIEENSDGMFRVYLPQILNSSD